jgi:hemerythrin
MIVWDDSMTTGLPQIDVQHHELIAKFNELEEAITVGRGREVAENVLDFLQFYAAWHFQREEDCMEKYHCPVAEGNKRAHADFLARFGRFYTQYQESGIDAQTVQDTYLELGRWIDQHIRQVDTHLYQCVKKS